MTFPYETLILVRSETTGDEFSKLEKQIDTLLTECKGELSLFDVWGKYRLAYPVQKNDYGIYILVRYKIDKDGRVDFFKRLHDLFKIKFDEIVMRSVNIKLDDFSLDYIKPEPIDHHKAGNLDAFLKENKMEGFLNNMNNIEKTPAGKVESLASSESKEVSSQKNIEVQEEKESVDPSEK